MEISHVSLVAKRVPPGGALGYRLVVRNTSKRPVKVMFDYAIHHLKANGSHSPKVLKGRSRDLAAGESWEITGRHPFQPVTTRVYYAGRHLFEPRLNGKAFPHLDFTLGT